MTIHHSFQLKPHNSFAISSVCSTYYTPSSFEQLRQIVAVLETPFYVLGDGSNSLFIDEQAPTIIHPCFKGIEVIEHDDHVLLTAGCGENWHQLVMYCLQHHYHGIENLALIPGSVGAAPVQNIGAYGVELSDVVDSVTWYDFADNQSHLMDSESCYFSYRNSIFKQALLNKGVITHVTFKLSKTWQPILRYQGLDTLDDNCSARDVVNMVIALRQSKLPEPSLLPNAGSFFKNPVVNPSTYEQLKNNFDNIPAYPQPNGQIKIAAGWLIEQCGLKGYRKNGVGVHDKQALVLINYGDANGQAVLELASYVQQQVQTKFSIVIEPEVRMITKNGLFQQSIISEN